MKWLEPEVTATAAFQPVSLADAKAHLVVEASTDDALIGGYLAAASAHVASITGLTLTTSTVVLRADGFDCAMFRLPAAPVESLAIKYTDAAGAEQTLDPATYVTALNGLSPTIQLAYGKSWPAHRWGLGSVTVTAECGYAQGELPTPLRQAILLIVGDWYSRRETVADGVVSSIPMQAVDALLANWRRSYV
jgi:uncharacterized phiE125 gp8 family phage protein